MCKIVYNFVHFLCGSKIYQKYIYVYLYICKKDFEQFLNLFLSELLDFRSLSGILKNYKTQNISETGSGPVIEVSSS
jgi:hypothetical protein